MGLSPSVFPGALQTGPDGKIYVARQGVAAISCITNPNLQGSACNYITNYLPLSGLTRLGLPSFPASLFCNIPSGTSEMESSNSIGIFPNPTNDYIQINGENIESIKIYDITGRLVKSISQPIPNTIDIRNLPEGLYPTAVETMHGTFLKKVVISR